jgi:ATP synthase protein I
MTEYQHMFRRQMKGMLYILSIYVLGWGFTSYPSIFLGLSLGGVFSMFLLWSMYHKINRLGQAVVDKEKKVRTLGSLQRLAVSGLAIVIAMRFPETFHLLSVVAGLMTYYFVIMIDFLLQSLRQHAGKRGE